jgi:hypothetical protein
MQGAVARALLIPLRTPHNRVCREDLKSSNGMLLLFHLQHNKLQPVVYAHHPNPFYLIAEHSIILIPPDPALRLTPDLPSGASGVLFLLAMTPCLLYFAVGAFLDTGLPAQAASYTLIQKAFAAFASANACFFCSGSWGHDRNSPATAP